MSRQNPKIPLSTSDSTTHRPIPRRLRWSDERRPLEDITSLVLSARSSREASPAIQAPGQYPLTQATRDLDEEEPTQELDFPVLGVLTQTWSEAVEANSSSGRGETIIVPSSPFVGEGVTVVPTSDEDERREQKRLSRKGKRSTRKRVVVVEEVEAEEEEEEENLSRSRKTSMNVDAEVAKGAEEKEQGAEEEEQEEEEVPPIPRVVYASSEASQVEESFSMGQRILDTRKRRREEEDSWGLSMGRVVAGYSQRLLEWEDLALGRAEKRLREQESSSSRGSLPGGSIYRGLNRCQHTADVLDAQLLLHSSGTAIQRHQTALQDFGGRLVEFGYRLLERDVAVRQHVGRVRQAAGRGKLLRAWGGTEGETEEEEIERSIDGM